ncbi:polynucleotide kinase-phosphatase [Cytobacillus purgationiresistens]|uniref:Polynucleotide kinase-phosphatase n=1 Tax=Cytobacillus purgationiresistens TaxID=863449 RepID=A0ABU0AF23_9BACI|nr:polynucleotide kinase-phosphatase [Cytobacillus purgationiresistens]MDQ0269625.1 polynucleotide kinase-phosphatase [Cytobacillus purgationiresistens]
MNITLPYTGIVLVIGPSGSGKTTLLTKLVEEGIIESTEITSSDAYRLAVGDTDFISWNQHPPDEADVLFHQYKNLAEEAFRMMDANIEARCRLNKTTFVDATHLQGEERNKYINLGHKYHLPVTAIVMDAKEETVLQRDLLRKQPRGKRRIKQQFQTFKKERKSLKKEGFSRVYFINEQEAENLQMSRNNHPLLIETGPGIDIIGDVHGCFAELMLLLEKLGYEKNDEGFYVHPFGRKFLSLGDIMSRGPSSLKTIQFFIKHVQNGFAYMIDSNHGWKIARWLDGRDVSLKHGDEKTAEEINRWLAELDEIHRESEKTKMREFLLNVPSHYIVIKNGIPVLVCTHAGIKDEFIGKQSKVISDFCRFGDTDGFDENNQPIRKDWFTHHRNGQLIVWGHDPKPQPLLVNNTINIDQGVVFGGKLTAYRFPEKTFTSIHALEDYAGEDQNPLIEWKAKRLDPPNIGNFIDGFKVLTENHGEVRIHADYVKPAIDLISTSTIPIEQLVYLPPTMSPVPIASKLEDYLEHPKEAIDYYRANGIPSLIAEKKHMGSRAVIFLFRNKEEGRKYTGIESLGTIYTRTGRRFFDKGTEENIVKQLNHDLHASNYFNQYGTDFVLLDAEIMPWNLKAKDLIKNQYEYVAHHALLDREMLQKKLSSALEYNSELQLWSKENEIKLSNARTFEQVFQKYCWEVKDTNSIQIAPFHILAHSHETLFHKSHQWHMEMNQQLASLSDLFVKTEYKLIDNESTEEEVIRWWEEMTRDGHEGIVIKPSDYIAKNKNKLIQPAIKVRGRKYLHIIYGMDYLLPENLQRLKERNTGKKQKLALNEFSLGIEGLNRFIAGESIERVHECVLGVLAMESDRIDPRL